MTTITQEISALPTAPNPNTQTPSVFNTNAIAHVAALSTMVTEQNTMASQMNTVAGEVNTNASTASLSSTSASGGAATAVAIANYAGAWSSLSGAKTVPLSVDHEGAFWILLENVADVTAEEPGSSAKWARAFGVGQIYERASNVLLTAADNGKIIDITSGTFSQTFDAAANLGPNWSVTIKNSGSGAITLDPNSTELIDEAATLTLYYGDVSLITCTGTALKTITQRGPAMEFLSSATASNTAAVSFTGLSDRYSSYEIHLLNVVPSSDNASLHLRTSANGGSSYDSGTSDYAYAYTVNEGSPTASAGANFCMAFPDVGSDTNETGVSGKITIIRPSASQYCDIITSGNYISASGNFYLTRGMARRLAAADVDAVQVYFSAGNIESGEIKLYGIRGR